VLRERQARQELGALGQELLRRWSCRAVQRHGHVWQWCYIGDSAASCATPRGAGVTPTARDTPGRRAPQRFGGKRASGVLAVWCCSCHPTLPVCLQGPVGGRMQDRGRRSASDHRLKTELHRRRASSELPQCQAAWQTPRVHVVPSWRAPDLAAAERACAGRLLSSHPPSSNQTTRCRPPHEPPLPTAPAPIPPAATPSASAADHPPNAATMASKLVFVALMAMAAVAAAQVRTGPALAHWATHVGRKHLQLQASALVPGRTES
jgi:hypothetical protein